MPDKEKAAPKPAEEPEEPAGRRRFLQRRIVKTGFGLPNRLETRVVSVSAGDDPPAGAVELTPDMKVERAWKNAGPVSAGAPEFDGVPTVAEEEA